MKRRLLTPRHREHDRRGHHFLARRLVEWRAGARDDVRIAGGVHDASRQDGLAARLALGDDAADGTLPQDRRDERAMQHRQHARLLHQHVRDVLEHLGVERMADRLRLRHRSAHRLGPLLELDADAFAVDGLFVPVPGEALDADLRDVAAEAAVALEERRLHTGPGRRQRSREAAGSAAHHEHLGLVDDVDLACRFSDALHGRSSRSAALRAR